MKNLQKNKDQNVTKFMPKCTSLSLCFKKGGMTLDSQEFQGFLNFLMGSPYLRICSANSWLKGIHFQSLAAKHKTFYILYLWPHCIVPRRFHPWEIQVAFLGEAVTSQHDPLTVLAGCSKCSHSSPDSDMDYRIFNMCTDIDACNCAATI